MRIGVFHVAFGPSRYDQLAAILITSIRRTMPGVDVVHLTDGKTPALSGVDDVVRRPFGPIALGCLEAYAICESDWLFVDTDVVIQQDVRSVFDQPFDVAVADRTGTLKTKEVGSGFMATMPFNKGAVFSRSPAFWHAAAAWLRQAPSTLQHWMGDQRAMCATIASGAFHVAILPNSYNYPPHHKNEDVRDKAIVHWKGKRKAWLLNRAA